MTADPNPERVQRVAQVAVGLVVAILAATFVIQAVHTARGEQASAATQPVAAAVRASNQPLGSLFPTVTPTSTTPAEKPVYTFVSAPDLLNADIGDIRSLPTWQPGMPNSDNKTDEDSLRRLYTEMNSWQPDAIFVAGDEVRGHWDVDNADLQIFGPVSTLEEKRAAIKNAGDFYYSAWKQRFPDNAIPIEKVYPAVGDHEIGDNPWDQGSDKLAAVPDFKQVWADHFTTIDGGPNRFAFHPTGTQFDGTAYATYLTPQLLLVTVDEFAWSKDGVDVTVAPPELDWLEEVLSGAPTDAKIIVQGHVPVLTPVRTRGSSNLHLEYGAASAFWQVLKKYGVDFYLNGEVHSFTATQLEDGDPIQISHGGLFAHGTTDYIVGRIYADGSVSIEAREMPDLTTAAEKERTLWQTRNNLQAKVRFPEHSTLVGLMTVDQDNHIIDREGVMEPFTPGVGTIVDSNEGDDDD